jgi:hypothetical protein
VPRGQRRSRTTEAESLAQQRSEGGARLVLHHRRWFVSAAMSGGEQSPHKVDVFARAQIFVEAADRSNCVGATNDRRRGHVRHACAGRNARWLVAEIEWTVALFIRGEPGSARRALDAWRNQCDPLVSEVGEQWM